MRNGVMTGYWEWFRKDGTKLRSGSFRNGEQTGEWTTCDKSGNVYKVTLIKPKKKKKEDVTVGGGARADRAFAQALVTNGCQITFAQLSIAPPAPVRRHAPADG